MRHAAGRHKILADDLLRRSTLPAGAVIRSWIEANPARLMLEVRLENPPRAGIVAVSQLAAEEDGAEAVTDGTPMSPFCGW